MVSWHSEPDKKKPINESLLTTQNDIIVRGASIAERLNIGASRIVARLASGNVVAATAAQILAVLSGQAGAAFNWNNQNLNNIKTLNLTDPTELTISGNAVTKTQGSHTIDTEGNSAEDYLDTINGGVTGDLLILRANNTARTTIVRHNVGNIQIREAEAFPTVHFNSPSGTSGIFYAAGFYDAPAADANLTQASTTVNHGAANSSEAAHIFVVAAGDGAKTG